MWPLASYLHFINGSKELTVSSSAQLEAGMKWVCQAPGLEPDLWDTLNQVQLFILQTPLQNENVEFGDHT